MLFNYRLHTASYLMYLTNLTLAMQVKTPKLQGTTQAHLIKPAANGIFYALINHMGQPHLVHMLFFIDLICSYYLPFNYFVNYTANNFISLHC